PSPVAAPPAHVNDVFHYDPARLKDTGKSDDLQRRLAALFRSPAAPACTCVTRAFRRGDQQIDIADLALETAGRNAFAALPIYLDPFEVVSVGLVGKFPCVDRGNDPDAGVSSAKAASPGTGEQIESPHNGNLLSCCFPCSPDL